MGALDVDQYGSCNEVTSKVHHGEPPAIDANAENVTTARKKPELVEHRRKVHGKEHVETLANEKNPEEIVDAVTRARRRATQHRRERAESEKAAAEARKQERFGRR